MTSLYVYSVSCAPLTSSLDIRKQYKKLTGLTQFANKHEIILWCIDATGTTHAVQISNYQTYVMLFPKRRDIINLGLQNICTASFPTDLQPLIHHVEIWPDARVLISFTNSKKKPMILVFLNNEKCRHTFIKAMTEKSSICDGHVRIKEILHRSTKATTQFLYMTGLKLQSFFVAKDLCPSASEVTNLFFGDGIQYHVNPSHELLFDEKIARTNVPILRKMYIRVFAHASTATRVNQFEPCEEIRDDAVRYIVYIIADDKCRAMGILHYGQYDNDESKLLAAFAQIVQEANIQVLVYASDEHIKPPNCLFYLTKRAMRYNINLNFSKLKTTNSKCELRKCKNSITSFLDFAHPGVERVDICCVLKKAMANPPLDGFTLLDALRHPEIVPDKKPFGKLLQLNYHELTSFSDHSTIINDLCLFVKLLYFVERDNGYVASQQNISYLCDTDLTSVIERGQQARVRNLFCRKLHDKKIVINSAKCSKKFVILRKPQQESNFPNPEWLENPAWSDLRNDVAPRHYLKQPIPPHLSGLNSLPHNNVIVAQEEKKVEAESKSDAPVELNQVQQPKAWWTKKKTKRQEENSVENPDSVKKPCQKAIATKKRSRVETNQPKVSNKRKKAATAATPRFSGGIVLDAMTGSYKEPEEAANTVDFGSLYPSIMEGYRICYMAVIYKKKWLQDPKLKVRFIPITESECVVYAESYDGVPIEDILPSIVHDVVALRKATRAEQSKHEKKSFMWTVLEGRQLAAKVVQNSVYGFTGSDTSGMTCTAIAAAVTNIGRWMNRTVRYIILFLGGYIYYGDTDSVMARFWVPKHLQTRDEIFAHIYDRGFMVAKFATGIFPAPNELNFESTKFRFLLWAAKTYAALEYSTKPKGWTLPPLPKASIKGVTAKKRDKCEHAQNIGMTLINKLLYDDNSNTEAYKNWYEKELRIVSASRPTSIDQLSPFIITCELNSEYKKTKDVLALHLADSIATESGARPRPGTRLAFVVTRKKHGTLHCYCCETPDHYLAFGDQLDFEYYMESQIFNCVKQVLSLEVHAHILEAFRKVTNTYLNVYRNVVHKNREITCFFKPRASR